MTAFLIFKFDSYEECNLQERGGSRILWLCTRVPMSQSAAGTGVYGVSGQKMVGETFTAHQVWRVVGN
jgi:hypothetical protein